MPRDAKYLALHYTSGNLPGLSINDKLYPARQLPLDAEKGRIFDISSLAGQTAKIGFGPGGDGVYVVDSISFIVPEPSTLALTLAAGSLFAGAHLLRGRSRP